MDSRSSGTTLGAQVRGQRSGEDVNALPAEGKERGGQKSDHPVPSSWLLGLSGFCQNSIKTH